MILRGIGGSIVMPKVSEISEPPFGYTTSGFPAGVRIQAYSTESDGFPVLLTTQAYSTTSPGAPVPLTVQAFVVSNKLEVS